MEKKEDPIIHHPEFVILDGTEDEAKPHPDLLESQREYLEAISRLGSHHYSFPLRFMLFLMSLGVGLAALFYLFATFMALVVSSLTFFSLETQVAHLKKCWKGCKKLAIVALGILVAVFSPPFGLGMILLYFLLHGENIDQGIVGRVFRSSIHPN